jgi:hypothetical protein
VPVLVSGVDSFGFLVSLETLPSLARFIQIRGITSVNPCGLSSAVWESTAPARQRGLVRTRRHPPPHLHLHHPGHRASRQRKKSPCIVTYSGAFHSFFKLLRDDSATECPSGCRVGSYWARGHVLRRVAAGRRFRGSPTHSARPQTLSRWSQVLTLSLAECEA